MGRIYTASNPYRPGDTAVLTTYLYDTLGRMTRVTTPNGAITSTAYSGQYQLVSDGPVTASATGKMPQGGSTTCSKTRTD